MNLSNYGDRIKFIRLYLGMSQEDFAEWVGISLKTLIRYEKNHRDPKIHILDNIVFVTGVNGDWLFNGNGLPFRDISVKSIHATPKLKKLLSDDQIRVLTQIEKREEDRIFTDPKHYKQYDSLSLPKKTPEKGLRNKKKTFDLTNKYYHEMLSLDFNRPDTLFGAKLASIFLMLYRENPVFHNFIFPGYREGVSRFDALNAGLKKLSELNCDQLISIMEGCPIEESPKQTSKKPKK